MCKDKKVNAFKAMDKGMQCRGFQYELGAEYEHEGDIDVCRAGFHSCENELDVLNYYPRNSRFFRVVAAGEIKQDGNKLCSSKLYIESELSFGDLFRSFFDKVVSLCRQSSEANTAGNYAHANTAGNYAHANTAGNYAHANTAGDEAYANTAGDEAHANTAGYRAHANTAGYRAHANTAGNYAHANTAGNYAHANTAGDAAHANTAGDEAHANTAGKDAIASALGINSRAMVKSDAGWLTVVNWVFEDNEWAIKEIVSAKPGMTIHETLIETNTWYWFEDGALCSKPDDE